MDKYPRDQKPTKLRTFTFENNKAVCQVKLFISEKRDYSDVVEYSIAGKEDTTRVYECASQDEANYTFNTLVDVLRYLRDALVKQ